MTSQPAEELFREAEELRPAPGVSFSVVDDLGLVQLFEKRPEDADVVNMVLLDVPEARALRDWLQRVIP